MKPLKITSPESLDASVAEACRLKLRLARSIAEMETQIAAVQKKFAAVHSQFNDRIAEVETDVQDYCAVHRAELFPDKKSRETAAAIFGFELAKHRVIPANRKITWADVLLRLRTTPWAHIYLRMREPEVNKEALIEDRDKLSVIQCWQLGIAFEQREQFFIRPKSEIAEPTTAAA